MTEHGAETAAQTTGTQATLPSPPGDRAPADDWTTPPRTTPDPDDTLIVDVTGFEGPLDLLLTLARTQKVDLARISILALVDQYLAFVERVRARRLELAADYLVMAAWLAYLKSRLLLPLPPQDDEPSGEELAAALAFRLRRLEAMREAAARLMARDRLGRDVFPRGAPEATAPIVRPEWQASLYDLLTAYAAQRQRFMITTVRVAARAVWSLADAREILERLIGRAADWTPIDGLVSEFMTPEMRATIIASTFSASLELVREGRMELRQTGAFAPLHARARPAGAEDLADLVASREDDR
ncbi:MAG: segregation/condensation protein A [Siculibacillus sp.]|nr:segregation/condensation protein A [Siculibacillus sp.]